MTRVQKAIFPGIAVGCLFLVFVTSLITNPQVAFAANPAAGVVGAAAVAAPQAAPSATAEAAAEAEINQPEAVPAPAADAATAADAAPAPAPEAQPVAEEPVEESFSCSVSEAFPDSVRQWCEVIQPHAEENGLDPNLITALILQESGGNPDAYSKSGAVGLMQVMPRDGIASGFMCINGPCFSNRPSMQDLYDPDFNVSYGTGMLAGLINKHGDIREALRAYGPMNMGYRYADIVLGLYERYR